MVTKYGFQRELVMRLYIILVYKKAMQNNIDSGNSVWGGGRSLKNEMTCYGECSLSTILLFSKSKKEFYINVSQWFDHRSSLSY